MPHRRARNRARRAVVLAAAIFGVVAAACAPGPSLEGAGPAAPEPVPDPVPPTTSPPPVPTPPSTLPPDAVPRQAPLDLFPVAPEDMPPLGPVDGRIAFHGADAALRSGRATVDLATGTLPAQPTWSRDGARLAVVSLDGRRPEIHVFDADGDEQASTPTERLYFFLSWSDDGSRIAALGPGEDENGDPRTVLDLLDASGALLHADVVAAESLYLAWEPGGDRIAAHAADRLLRIDGDGSVTDLGHVGLEFVAPKWIPTTNEILLVTDIESSAILARRAIDGADTLRTLGPAGPQTRFTVNPSGRVAAIARNFDVEGDPTAERIDLGLFPQTAEGRSGSVEILDLETGERVEIFVGFTDWIEWNPQGTQLLIHQPDPAAGTSTWWIHDHPGEDVPNDPEATLAVPIVSFTPTPVFAGSYLAFGDQYVESPRLWSPAGTEFVYAELTDAGSLIRTVRSDGTAEPATVGAGEVGFWSPARPSR